MGHPGVGRASRWGTVDVVDVEDEGVGPAGFEAEAEVFDAGDDGGEVSVLGVGGFGVVVGAWEWVDGDVVASGEAGLIDDVAVEAGGDAIGEEIHGDVGVDGGVDGDPADVALDDPLVVGRVIGVGLVLGELRAVLGEDHVVDGAGLDLAADFEVEGVLEQLKDHEAACGRVELLPDCDVLGRDLGLKGVGL
jgi:hypothetical protein